MRHGTCFRRRLSAHHAGAAPHSAVAELGVVRRSFPSLMNASQLHLPFRTRVISFLAISVAGRASRSAACREVAECLAAVSFGAGASLPASANHRCRRERTNARQVSTSRRSEGVSKVCASAASLAQGAFGGSCGLRGRLAMRAPGQSQSERRTPNQALQRTGVAVTLAAFPSSNPSRPSVALSHARWPFLRSTPQPSRQPRPSLSLGSLGVPSRPV